MSQKRIEKIIIQGFRGVTNKLIVDFGSTESQDPLSMVLCGDNGSGKSSVVDALEFVLQGRIARRRKAVSYAVSRLSDKACEIQVFFSDGVTHTRDITLGTNGEWNTSKQSIDEFSISPVVLRRQDILHFWDTPEHEREIIFYDFLKISPQIDLTENQAERTENAEQKRLQLKEERRKLITQLSINLGVKAEIIPLDTVKFEEYVLHNVYGEESKKQKTRIERSRYKQSTNLEPINPILDRLIKKIRLVNKQIGETQKEIRNIKRENMPSNQSTPSQMAVREVLLNAGQRITDAFIKISPSRSFVSHIEIVRGKISDVSLSAIVQLTNGKKASPVDIFSEANLDLLALLIYLYFAKEAAEKGQAKFLVLDDVLQSVDASIRLLVTEYIIQDFKDWQLVFTVHDRLWQEQLRALLRRLNHGFVEKEIVRWEPLTGPIIINVSRNDSTLLQEAMLSGDIFWICSQAGMLLEKIANALSISLQSSVTRRKDDKYTLGDLWPGVLKILKKTTLKETVEETDRWMHLRNLIGAHFNEWAQTLSRQEAQLFGESVIKLYERTYCFTCYKIVEQVSNNSKWQCRCGGIVIL